MEERNLTSAHSCNMYYEGNNLTCESRSNLITSHQCAGNLRGIRIKNWKKFIIDQININSKRNKFELLPINVKDNVDILLITETKINQSFVINKTKNLVTRR